MMFRIIEEPVGKFLLFSVLADKDSVEFDQGKIVDADDVVLSHYVIGKCGRSIKAWIRYVHVDGVGVE